jgi:hypothetical protein
MNWQVILYCLKIYKVLKLLHSVYKLGPKMLQAYYTFLTGQMHTGLLNENQKTE